MTIRSLAAMAFACSCGFAGAQALYRVPPPVPAPGQPAASVVLDARAAADARSRDAPVYVESIVVEARNPDARRLRPLEVRFAEALMARPSPLAAISPFDDTPCMSLPSTWNNIGDAHVPLSGCPR